MDENEEQYIGNDWIISDGLVIKTTARESLITGEIKAEIEIISSGDENSIPHWQAMYIILNEHNLTKLIENLQHVKQKLIEDKKKIKIKPDTEYCL